jgi:ABC-type amino acid transport substrate-binding protein
MFSYIGLALLAGLLLTNTSQARTDCLKLTTSFKQIDQLIVPSLISKFAEYGLCVEVSHVSADRATLLIEQGQIDGELFRIRDYINEISEVAVRVEEPIVEGYGLIVGKTETSQSDKLLVGKPVAMVRGFIWQERVFPKRSVPVMVEDSKAGFAMLKAGRVSALLIDTISFKLLVSEADKLYQRRVTPKMSAYLYLHNRNAHLLPAFEAAIKGWKKAFPANTDVY